MCDLINYEMISVCESLDLYVMLFECPKCILENFPILPRAPVVQWSMKTPEKSETTSLMHIDAHLANHIISRNL